MTLDYDLEEHIQKSEVCRFYEGKCVLITGVTGFLGKFVLEKLIRTCSGVNKIFILIRNKNGVHYKNRINELINDCPLFTRFHKEFDSKVVLIQYDLQSEDLELSETDRIQLQQNVNVVFHTAGTVRENQPLKTVIETNILGTMRLMDLCNTFIDLQAIVYISTLFVHTNIDNLQEKFYPTDFEMDDITNMLEADDDSVQVLHPKIVNQWISTNFFSKAVTENILYERYKNLPIAVFRPAITYAPTDDHPQCGYLESVYDNISAIPTLCSIGEIRTVFIKKDRNAHLIPADYAANAVLTIALDVFKNRYKAPKIYHFSPVNDNYMPLIDFHTEFLTHSKTFGLENAVWYPFTVFTGCKHYYTILKFFLHLLPAFFMDIGSTIMCKERNMLNKYQQIDGLLTSLDRLNLENKAFATDNTTSAYETLSNIDRHLFPFDMRKLDWKEYVRTSVRGSRKYFLNEDDDTIPETQSKFKKLAVIHYALIIFMLGATVHFLFSWMPSSYLIQRMFN